MICQAAPPVEVLLGIQESPKDAAQEPEKPEEDPSIASTEEDDADFEIPTIARAPYRTYFGSGYVHEFSSNFSGNGSISVNRGFAGAGVGLNFESSVQLSLGIAWSGDWYSFEGDSNLSPAPGVAPWNNIQAMYMGARVTADLDDHWRITTGASILFAGEPGVDVSEAATIQGIISATWALDKTFFIGGGVLLSSQLEDSILAIPLILIYWEFADDFVLSNILGPETYPTGAGLEVAWRPNRGTELSIGGRYENRRFRLDDSGPANRANGVGQDTGFPIWARATWKFRGGFRIDLVGGVSLFNSYELDDSVGEEIGSADLDPTPFLGLFASYRF